MAIGISVDPYEIVKDILNYFKKRKISSISERDFIRRIEKRIKKKLSRGGKQQLLYTLEDRGIITRTKSRNGRPIIIIGDFNSI